MAGTRWLTISATLLLSVLIACSRGGGKQESQSEPRPSPAASPAAQAAPATPGADRAQAGRGCLANLSSYRYSGTVAIKLPAGSGVGGSGDVKVSGAAVMPDRFHSKVQAGGESFEVISIGTDVWTRQGNGPWEKNPGSPGVPSFQPQDFCQVTSTDLERAGVRGTRERVGGVDAVRYRLKGGDLDKLGTGLEGPAAALTALFDTVEMNLWFTEKERWPLRITLAAEQSGTDAVSFKAEFNLTDFNARDITIEPPR